MDSESIDETMLKYGRIAFIMSNTSSVYKIVYEMRVPNGEILLFVS